MRRATKKANIKRTFFLFFFASPFDGIVMPMFCSLCSKLVFWRSFLLSLLEHQAKNWKIANVVIGHSNRDSCSLSLFLAVWIPFEASSECALKSRQKMRVSQCFDSGTKRICAPTKISCRAAFVLLCDDEWSSLCALHVPITLCDNYFQNRKQSFR